MPRDGRHGSDNESDADFASTLPPVARVVERRLAVKAKVFDESEYEVWPPKPRSSGGEPQLPDIHLGDVLCVGPIMAISLYRLFGVSLFSLLATAHPVVLLLIRASIAALVSAGALVHSGEMPLWVALLAPLPYLFLDDPFIYWAGRRYGDRLTDYFIDQDPRWKPRIARGERIMERWGFWAIIVCNMPVVPIPVSVIYFIAGDSRMPIKLFVLADLIGLELLVAMSVGIGYLLGDRAKSVVNGITHYGTIIFWITIVLAVVYIVMSTRRNLRLMRQREAERERDNIT